MAKETKSTKEKETKTKATKAKTAKKVVEPKVEKEVIEETNPVETIVYNDDKSKYDAYECDYGCECEECNKCNCGCNSNRNFICLIFIIILLFVNTILLSLNLNGESSSKKENKTTTTTASSDTSYDVSKFKEVNTDEFIEKFNEDKYNLFYIGRPTCGYCVKFVPILNAVQDSYKFETIYFDISKYSSDDANKIIGLDEEFFTGENTAYGYTPMMLITKDGKIVDSQIGYSDQATFEKLVSKYFDKK